MMDCPLPTIPSLSHVHRLTDDVGIIQHATFDIPNRHTGYCTDDVARAFMVSLDAQNEDPENAEKLQIIYLGFLHFAQLPDGRFHNFMSYDRQWLDDIGDGDAIGRAIWALGYGERHSRKDQRRKLCGILLDGAVANGTNLEALHSMSYAALGISRSYLARERKDTHLKVILGEIAQVFIAALQRESSENWCWFEHHLTYDSARLPEALLAIGAVLGMPSLIAEGLRAFEFYLQSVFEGDMLVPIGSNGWYSRDGSRALHPQQPIEAAATIDALSLAFALTKESKYQTLADQAFAWFHGKNTAGESLVKEDGCADGIDVCSVNKNMGAESTISYVSAAYRIRNFGHGL